jgi:hypothetical protein
LRTAPIVRPIDAGARPGGGYDCAVRHEGDAGDDALAAETVDVAALFARLKEEVRRSGADPGGVPDGPEAWRTARDEAERLWPVSADRSLRLRPGVRGGLGTPVKAVLRKMMRWYVEPVAYDQRSFNAAVLRLLDDLEARIVRIEGELARRGGGAPRRD